MRAAIFSSLMLACVLSVSACATVTPAYVPIAANAREAVESTEVVAPVKQSEIYVFVPPSQIAASGGGGLLLALVDAGVDAQRTKNAEAAVKPLRDAMIDYNFDDKLRDNLQKDLAPVGWLKVSGTRVVKDASAPGLDKAISGSKQAAVLVVAADYQLSNDGTTLNVILTADLFANTKSLAAFKPAKGGDAKTLSAPGNALYRNRFVHTSIIPGTVGDRAANMATWSADKGKALRAALDEAVVDVTGQLARDLSTPPPPPAAPAAK